VGDVDTLTSCEGHLKIDANHPTTQANDPVMINIRIACLRTVGDGTARLWRNRFQVVNAFAPFIVARPSITLGKKGIDRCASDRFPSQC